MEDQHGRTRTGWLLAVLPADCKLSWKKIRAFHGKGIRMASEEARGTGVCLECSSQETEVTKAWWVEKAALICLAESSRVAGGR